MVSYFCAPAFCLLWSPFFGSQLTCFSKEKGISQGKQQQPFEISKDFANRQMLPILADCKMAWIETLGSSKPMLYRIFEEGEKRICKRVFLLPLVFNAHPCQTSVTRMQVPLVYTWNKYLRKLPCPVPIRLFKQRCLLLQSSCRL